MKGGTTMRNSLEQVYLKLLAEQDVKINKETNPENIERLREERLRIIRKISELNRTQRGR